MKICVLYHPRSEYARIVEEYVHDFERQRGKTIKMISLDTRDGAATASLYDITQHPALLVLREDGQVVQMWTGNKLPLMDEVVAYANR
jgi:hypothetical protein